MSAVAVPPYTPHKYRRARIGVLVLVFLGLMFFAAVRTMAVDCRNEHQRLLLNSGGCIALHQGGCLLLNEQRERCEVVAGDLRWALSERAAAILRKFGVRFYI
jgi:hypothetical protein